MTSAHLDSSIIVLDEEWDDDSTICSHGVRSTGLRPDNAMSTSMKSIGGSSAGLSSLNDLSVCSSSVCSTSIVSASANSGGRLAPISPSPLSRKTPMILSLPPMSQRPPSSRPSSRGSLMEAPSLIEKRVSFSLAGADTSSRSMNDVSTYTSSSFSSEDSQNDNADDYVECEITNPLQKHIYQIASRHDMTREEIAATWYSLEEVDGMKDAMRSDSRAMREIIFDTTPPQSVASNRSGGSADPDEEEEHSARGLEHLFTRESLIKKQQSRGLAVHAVLAAQDQGVECPEQLASISRKFTLPARIYAAQMGSLDATKVRPENGVSDGSGDAAAEGTAETSSSLATYFQRQVSLGDGDNASIAGRTVTSSAAASASNFSFFDGDIDNNKALELHQMESMRQRNRAMHVKTVNDFMASSLAELVKERDPRVIQEVTQMLFTSMSNMTML